MVQTHRRSNTSYACGADPQTIEHVLRDCLFGDFTRHLLTEDGTPTGRINFETLLHSKPRDLHRFIRATYAFTNHYGTHVGRIPPPYSDTG